MKKWLLIMSVAVGLSIGCLVPAEAKGPTKPARSGTILGGAGVELGGGQPWEQSAAERSGCEYAVDCRPWLQSGCTPALAGHDPVVTASIVDVGELADGRTTWALRMVAPSIPPWGLFPGAVIQLWRKDCTEIHKAKRHSIGSQSTCSYSDWGHTGGRARSRSRSEPSG